LFSNYLLLNYIMKPLYTQAEFCNSKSEDFLTLQCYQCNDSFPKEKKRVKSEIKLQRGECKFCSHNCHYKSKINLQPLNCTNCGQSFLKSPSQIKKSKSDNHFCSRPCAATYNNKHKTHGTRRSKLEAYIEQQLSKLYPELNIVFNGKEAIGSELDIFIPSLNLGIELNGIFHYEPIYGVDKLRKIQENDISKSKACHDAKIDFCTIDTSGQKYFKESTSQKYIDIITTIIKERQHL